MAVNFVGSWSNRNALSPGGTNYVSSPVGTLDPDVKYQADTGLKAAQLPWDYKREVFGQVFPLLQNTIGKFGSNMSNIGGNPTINTNPIYSQQQIQQQVNAGRASTDQSTQTQQRLASQGIAGRGFGANSPLAQAIQGQLAAQGMATNAENERQTRMTAAQQNAQQRLGAQTAYEQAYTERMKPWLQYYGNTQNALLAAISGLI